MRLRPVAIAWIGAIALAGCGDGERPLTVGSKDFTEQLILGEIIAEVAESAGIRVDRAIPYGGTFENIEALKRGDIDVYPEYNGTGLVLLGQPPISDGDQAYARVEELYGPLGLEWGERLGFANDYELVMRTDRAQDLGITRVSELATIDAPVRFGIDDEFQERPVDGYAPLLRRYGLEAEAALVTSPLAEGKAELYDALLKNQVDVVEGFSTDGQIAEFDLTVLEDDLDFFPTYQPAPLVRRSAQERFPALADALDRLAGTIDTAAMQQMNAAVELEGQDPRDVAHRFLAEAGIIEGGDQVAAVEELRLAVGPFDSRSGQIAQALTATRRTFQGRNVSPVQVADPMRAMTGGQARIALVDGSSFFDLTDDVFPQQNVPAQALGVVGYDMAHLITPRASGVRSLADVRTLGVGPEDGSSERVARMVVSSLALVDEVTLEAAGSGEEDPLPAQIRALQDGQLDALFLMAASGHPEIGDLIRDNGLRLLSLPEWQSGNNLIRFPFLRLSRIPADTYEGQDQPIDTIGAQVVLAGPSRSTIPVGSAGPGAAAIGEILPLADKSVLSLNENLAGSEQIDPALPSPAILRPQPRPAAASVSASPAQSFVNLIVILVCVYLAHLYFRKPPRQREPSLRAQVEPRRTLEPMNQEQHRI
jgi:glycine betaine/choline ABC-type transport system substrate-binding protein